MLRNGPRNYHKISKYQLKVGSRMPASNVSPQAPALFPTDEDENCCAWRQSIPHFHSLPFKRQFWILKSSTQKVFKTNNVEKQPFDVVIWTCFSLVTNYKQVGQIPNPTKLRTCLWYLALLCSITWQPLITYTQDNISWNLMKVKIYNLPSATRIIHSLINSNKTKNTINWHRNVHAHWT